MNATQLNSLRNGGLWSLAGGTGCISAAFGTAIVWYSTNTPDKLYRWPYQLHAFYVVCVFAAALHLIVLAGLVGYRESGAAGAGRLASRGLAAAIAAMALLTICELLGIPIAEHAESSGAAAVVDSLFALASFSLLGGLIAAGIATRRNGLLAGWPGSAMLAAAVCIALTIPFSIASLVWAAVALHGLGFAILGVGMLTASSEPVPVAQTS